eukprot:COSAG02_NODE_28100_length_596_cov_1.094567_1_plen_39_part_10
MHGDPSDRPLRGEAVAMASSYSVPDAAMTHLMDSPMTPV